MIVPFGVIILNDRKDFRGESGKYYGHLQNLEEGGKNVNDEIYLTAFSSDHSFP
jgi:hypothetical protein